jgi:DNA polymerase I-like protein with 3'-5' exonuclease and polymerase domains
MMVTMAGAEADFRPWTPACGTVFTTHYAFDCETARIDEERPWLTPPFVLGAAYDGRRGYFLPREHAAAFVAAHEAVPVVMHHAVFDLAVIQLLAPELDIYRRVDADRVWDTQLLHRLFTLASEGHTSSGKGQSTLEHCAETYLDIRLPKDLVDARGNPVRTSYGRWLNRPPREIEPVYLEYLAGDAVVTFRLFETLRERIKALLESSSETWGYVSPAWLAEQVRRWGWLTHHIQLRASIVLAAITANGMYLDLDRREELLAKVRAVADEQRIVLRGYGYCPGQEGSGKALQEILRRLDGNDARLGLARTKTGVYATSEEALAHLKGAEPFIDALLAYRAVEKLQSAFLDKMSRRVLHPAFDVLKTTGRTSSFGDLNAQNLPRDDRVRMCFVPAPGHVFIDADYKAIEMATLAQAVESQFGLESELAVALNADRDPHRLIAARVTGKPEAEVTNSERQKAKPINFGKPGGMGNATLKSYAKANYNVDLSEDEVEALSGSWFALFPEMEHFLRDEVNLGEEIARHFDLTPASHHEHTGSRRFLDHPENGGREHLPHPILGGMCLKVLKVPEPETRAGEPYGPDDVDYFWSRVESRWWELDPKLHEAIRCRRPSEELQRAVIDLVGRAGVFTLTGRLRADATYCARHNSVFQGLAADGAKLALWKLWRAGYRIANFIHDEVLVEVPEDSDLDRHAAEVRRLKIAGMAEVVPDVRIDVECVAATAWTKVAKPVRDAAGRLLTWSPTAAEEEVRHATAP